MPSRSMADARADANKAAIERFYSAFKSRDAATMAASYAPGATFSDPAFPGLVQPQVSAMWTMLLSNEAKVWDFDFSDVQATESTGSAKWTATYLFGPDQRKVVNHVTSFFTFNEAGLITAQRDSFDFWAWSSQALGLTGRLLGWSSFLSNQVQKNARSRLDAWMAKH